MVRQCSMPSNRALRLPCKVYVFVDGIWPQTYTRVSECSHASVGLAQARPNERRRAKTQQCYCPRASSPRRWSDSVPCLRTELCDFRAKCTFLSTVYGLKHTHASRNAVTLVWGSLKLAPMNVGGLKLNGVISHALVPREDDQRVFHAFEESFATSVQSVRFWSTAED